MALQYKQSEYLKESIPKEKSTSYQAYRKPATASRIKEILFFFNLAIFSTTTVLATFILLSFGVGTVLSFIMALAIGVLGLRLTQAILRHQYKKRKQIKRTVS